MSSSHIWTSFMNQSGSFLPLCPADMLFIYDLRDTSQRKLASYIRQYHPLVSVTLTMGIRPYPYVEEITDMLVQILRYEQRDQMSYEVCGSSVFISRSGDELIRRLLYSITSISRAALPTRLSSHRRSTTGCRWRGLSSLSTSHTIRKRSSKASRGVASNFQKAREIGFLTRDTL